MGLLKNLLCGVALASSVGFVASMQSQPAFAVSPAPDSNSDANLIPNATPYTGWVYGSPNVGQWSICINGTYDQCKGFVRGYERAGYQVVVLPTGQKPDAGSPEFAARIGSSRAASRGTVLAGTSATELQQRACDHQRNPFNDAAGQ